MQPILLLGHNFEYLISAQIDGKLLTSFLTEIVLGLAFPFNFGCQYLVPLDVGVVVVLGLVLVFVSEQHQNEPLVRRTVLVKLQHLDYLVFLVIVLGNYL